MVGQAGNGAIWIKAETRPLENGRGTITFYVNLGPGPSAARYSEQTGDGQVWHQMVITAGDQKGNDFYTSDAAKAIAARLDQLTSE